MPACRTLLLAGACLAGWNVPALAQAMAPQAEPGVSVEDCRIEAVPNAGDDQAGAPAPAADLATKLDKCNGVLQPPQTGDAEIREPAPNTGETPVIPPGALPEQPPAEPSPSTPPARSATPT